jgi:hypothetical protein
MAVKGVHLGPSVFLTRNMLNDGMQSSVRMMKTKTMKNWKTLKKEKTMSSWLIAVIGVVYAVVAIDLWLKGDTGHSIAFVGYSLGNVGLYMAVPK